MRAARRDSIAELEGAAPAEPDEVQEARALLAWADDGHFTFLGYREYELDERGRRGPACARSPAPGSASCARPRPSRRRRRLATLPPRACAARTKRLLDPHEGELARHGAPPRVPRLHRRQALRRRGRGRRRAPLPRPLHDGRLQGAPARGPGRAPQGRGGDGARRASRPAATPRRRWWRSSRPTRATSCSRSPRTTCTRSRRASSGSASASACGCSCGATSTSASCRAWSSCRATASTPSNRERIEEILREAFDAESVDFELRLSESVLVRIHFIVRTGGGALPDYDVEEIEARIVEATREWTDDLARRADRGVRRGARQPPVPPLRARVPDRATAPTGSPRSAVADIRRIEALERRRRPRH